MSDFDRFANSVKSRIGFAKRPGVGMWMLFILIAALGFGMFAFYDRAARHDMESARRQARKTADDQRAIALDRSARERASMREKLGFGAHVEARGQDSSAK